MPPAPAVMLATVIVLREIHPLPGQERCWPSGAVIGRGLTCDLRLCDPLVSRRHARLLRRGRAAAIEDLGSANGVFVNGLRAHGIRVLDRGDVLQLGGTIWLVLRLSPAGRARS